MRFDVYLKRLGHNLLQARLRAGLTQDEAATKAVSVREIRGLERGRVNPTTRSLFALARVYDVRVADIMQVGEERVPVDLQALNLEPSKRGPKGPR